MLFDGLDNESLDYVLTHQGHTLVIVTYTDNDTREISIECFDCNEVVVTLVAEEVM